MLATRRPAAVGDAFAAYEWVAEVESRGDAKLTCIAHDGSRVELRMIEPEVFGNLLQHLTGSKHHNVALREAAVRAGLKVSEYGIEQVETGEVLHCREEAEVYERLGMDWIPPELRENRGEIEAARNHALPDLVTVDQIRGDLHAHTDWSDGKMTLEQLVEGARAKGYEYLNVTDHSPAVGFGMGLDAGRMRKQIERVRELAATMDGGFTLLVGAEVDILKNGSLDYSDELMAELDVVVASLHASHRLNEADQTKRLCAAMENPHVDIIGHPTGRMLGKRPAYAMDMEAVIAKAVETGTVLEVSGQPHRLDLTDSNVRMAVAAGAKLSIDTDAHSLAALDYMRFGVMNARRGWASPKDVVNTRTLETAEEAAQVGGRQSEASSSTTCSGPSTQASACSTSSGGPSAERTAILIVASRNASRSVRSSPTYIRFVIRLRPRSRRTADPLSIATGGRTSSTIRPKLQASPARSSLGTIWASR